MEKKSIYALIAIIIAVVIIIASTTVILYKPSKTVISSPLLISVTPSTVLTTTGVPVQFIAKTSGNISEVTWNFGDGTTGTGLVVNHTYTEPGKYLIFVNVTGPNGYSNNLNNLWQISVISQAINPSITGEITQPLLLFNTTLNPKAPIVYLNYKTTFISSYSQPPTATNWSIGYYLINYGDGNKSIESVYYNYSSGLYYPGSFSHIYTKTGFYPVNLTILTYNNSMFSKYIVTNNLNNTQFLPTKYYYQIINSSEFRETSYISTIFVANPNQMASIIQYKNISQSNIINVAEVVPEGPFSFDPAIAPSTIDLEIIQNVYEPLIAYNQSTFNLVPVVAEKVPTIANGLVSANGLNYTFPIRSGLRFSNGDVLNAWDVYVSIVRDLLFTQGIPGTNGYLIAQDLLPGGGFAPGLFTNGTALFDNITRAITYNNTTQTVTFHLLYPDPAFLSYLASLWGVQILDWNWLVEHGAGITFTPSGFLNYTQYGNQQNYNTYIRWNLMGSGPYMVGSYLQGQSILLVPNPNFTPIPGIFGYNEKVNNKILITWVKDTQTAIMMLQSGQADIVTRFPSYAFSTVLTLQSQGKANVISFPSERINFFVFNFDVNITLLHTLGSQYNMPFNYFANPLVRKAFAYSFNYTNYINNLLGNSIYHIDFGFNYAGMIPKGMPGYIPLDEIKNLPVYNLTLAKQYLKESGFYNISVNIPVIVPAGDSTDYAAAAMWGQALNSIDKNITVTPLYQPFSTIIGYAVPNGNPMPIYFMDWNPPWNYPTSTFNFWYLAGELGGYYPPADGITQSNLIAWNYSDEAQQWENLQNYIVKAETSSNTSIALQYFDYADQIAINLTLYIYLYQQNVVYVSSPSVQGLQYEMNPITNSGSQFFYFYLKK
jgi:ABC-type transport system substrate-binding protein